MDDIYNLICNPHFQNSTNGWSIYGSTITYDETDSINDSNGSILLNGGPQGGPFMTNFIEVDCNNTYRLEMDLKGTNVTRTNYICVFCYDKDKNQVGIRDVNVQNNTITTLAQPLNDGDIVVYLNSVNNWNNATNYGGVSILDSPAWGNKKCLYRQGYKNGGIDTTNKTVTLSSAWAGGSWAANTPVGNIMDSFTYIYVFQGGTSVFPSTWTHKAANFVPRHNSKYIRIGAICYTGQKIKFANISVKNISKTQYKNLFVTDSIKNITKTGIVQANTFNECILPIRYIRDWVKGSNVSQNCHWCEIQAFDINGINMAYAATGKLYNGSTNVEVTPTITGRTPDNSSNTRFPIFHQITNNKIITEPYLGGITSNGYVILDLGQVFDITQLKIWHYFGDNRIYNGTKTEVSTDGVTWITVFDSGIEGTYQETSTGHTINLNKNNVSLTKRGEVLANEFYEI